MNKRLSLLLCACVFQTAIAEVSINPPFAMPDVNLVAYKDRVYAFCGTDLEPFGTEPVFKMPYWRCFSSNDLINWTFESYLDPKDMYMGESDKCFAGHGAYRNGKWYWFFSDFVNTTGVAIADTPKGPWKDALGKPILPKDISITHEYDNCIFQDDDGKVYIVFGSWIGQKEIGYHIAEMNDDMLSLKEKPRLIEVEGFPKGQQAYIPVDASFLHKHNGLYYLSWRRPYAVAKNPYGPYTFIGLQDAHGHLGFFDFRNQNFVNYTSLKPELGYRRRYRFCSLAYVHYKDDGSIAPMEPLISEHGVGQYDAGWPAIQAEWYMAVPDGVKKKEIKDGFEVRNFNNGDYAIYPNIHSCPGDASIELTYACGHKSGGAVSIRAYAQNGPEIGRGQFSSTGGWDMFKTVTIPLDKNPKGTLSLAFVIEGDAGTELIRLDSFRVLP